MSDFFNDAYRLASSRFTREQWLALPPQQVTQAIYQAIRELDEAATARGSGREGPEQRESGQHGEAMT